MSLVRGIIFDIDGTLINSNDEHAKAWLDVLLEFGYKAQFEEVRRLIGMGGDKLTPILTGHDKDSPLGRRLTERRSAIFKERYLPALKAFPGSRDLCELFSRRGKKMVVASSARGDELENLIKIAGAADFIESHTSSSDAERSKPDPDIVQVALGELGLDRDEVVMIGDTPYDIEAAARAGIRAIAFRCGGWPDSGLKGAVAIYDGPADLCARYEKSPIARGLPPVAMAAEGAGAT